MFELPLPIDLTLLNCQSAQVGRRQQIRLDRQHILDEALALIEDEGLDALSTRRLATRLSVQAPALYWHIGGKEDLLGLVARAFYAEARAAVPAATDWREWLIGFGWALHQLFESRRDAARVCAIARPVSQDAESAAVGIAAPLVGLGLPADRALAYQASVISLTLGWAIFSLNGPIHAFLDEMFDVEESYRIGLEALVRGYHA